MSAQGENLSDLIAIANTVTNETVTIFGGLTVAQLNWKPDVNQWSVAQCFDHLVTANGFYFPVLEQIVKGEKRSTIWERLPLLPAFWGRMLINIIDPKNTAKQKAPQIFSPSNSNIDEGIISQFAEQQHEIVKYMKATENLDLKKIIISSPVSNLITYSLMDAYIVIVKHEQRHFLQAKRVLGMTGFPNYSGV